MAAGTGTGPGPPPPPGGAAQSPRTATLATLLGGTALSFAVLYAPQPLLPRFADHFAVDEPTAALLLTVVYVPLTAAPLSYGLFLERTSPTTVLARGSLLLAAAQAALALAMTGPSFALCVAARSVQGLLLPALFTATMTALSALTAHDELRRIMSFYVATTVVAAFFGRLLAGATAQLWTWTAAFWITAAGLLLQAAAVRRYVPHVPCDRDRRRVAVVPNVVAQRSVTARPGEPSEADEPSHWALVSVVLTDPFTLVVCGCVQSCFHAFSSIMTYLPFRVREVHGSSELLAALMYSPYLVGALSALASRRVTARTGVRGAIGAGLGTACLAPLLLLSENLGVMFAGLCAVCVGFFLVHSVAAAAVNRRHAKHKAMANAVYVTLYYFGGLCGSFAPGYVYQAWAWELFAGYVLCWLLVGVGLVVLLRGVWVLPGGAVSVAPSSS